MSKRTAFVLVVLSALLGSLGFWLISQENASQITPTQEHNSSSSESFLVAKPLQPSNAASKQAPAILYVVARDETTRQIVPNFECDVQDKDGHVVLLESSEGEAQIPLAELEGKVLEVVVSALHYSSATATVANAAASIEAFLVPLAALYVKVMRRDGRGVAKAAVSLLPPERGLGPNKLAPRRLVANDEGVALFQGLTSGATYLVRARYPGYAQRTQRLRIQGPRDHVQVCLDDGASIFGRVVSKHAVDKPFKVRVVHQEDAKDGFVAQEPEASTMTDNGYFRFYGLKAGWKKVVLYRRQRFGIQDIVETKYVDAGVLGDHEDKDLGALDPAGPELCVVVENRFGKRLSGAKLLIGGTEVEGFLDAPPALFHLGEDAELCITGLGLGKRELHISPSTADKPLYRTKSLLVDLQEEGFLAVITLEDREELPVLELRNASPDTKVDWFVIDEMGEIIMSYLKKPSEQAFRLKSDLIRSPCNVVAICPDGAAVATLSPGGIPARVLLSLSDGGTLVGTIEKRPARVYILPANATITDDNQNVLMFRIVTAGEKFEFLNLPTNLSYRIVIQKLESPGIIIDQVFSFARGPQFDVGIVSIPP